MKSLVICAAFFAAAVPVIMTPSMADTSTPSLEPNAVFTIGFPELPPTFIEQKGAEKVPTQMSVRLPSNYTTTGKFPLLVFLQGGDGGKADSNAAGGTSSMVNNQDYISVALPLFKKAYDPKTPETFPISDEFASEIPAPLLPMIKNFPVNGIVVPGDYETISAAYGTMLKKLNEVVPNIDASRSTLAGFSNGAHTIGVLLARQDPGVLGQFHSFAMVEGGVALPIALGKSGHLPSALGNHRYLSMFSDVSGSSDWQAETLLRPLVYNLLKQFAENAKANGFDFTFVAIHNGHHFGTQEKPLFVDWMRQDLKDPAAK